MQNACTLSDAQRRLWPRLSADKREEMLESILDPAEREH